MSEISYIVPWYNSKEWNKVYNKIYLQSSTLIEKQEALNLLIIWKARCPSLPSGIESTLSLLEVHIQDMKNSDNFSNDQLLRLSYSSAIMRFVNHMLDVELAKGTTLYQAAKNLGVPDWIVDLRHDVAHSHNLPAIELLREASFIALQWLKENYWDKHKLLIKGYISSQKCIYSFGDEKIAALMNLCISLSICSNPSCKINKIADIPDLSMQESIITDFKDLFEDLIDFSRLKSVHISKLINIMFTNSEYLMKSKDISRQVNKALLGEDSLFLSREVVILLGENNWKTLNKNYIQCFELLITYLHRNDLLLDFILELIKITQINENKNHRCRLAALWLSEILQALKRCKQFTNKMKRATTNDSANSIFFNARRKSLKSLFYHWFPNKKTCLLLDFHKAVPRQLTDIDYIRPIISSYNPYLTYYISDLLNLIEPHLPKLVKVNICKLAKLISTPEKLPLDSSKIYTVEDLKLAKNLTNNSFKINEQHSNSNEDPDKSFRNENIKKKVVKDQSYGIWRLSSSEHDWSNYPIGHLWKESDNDVQMEKSDVEMETCDLVQMETGNYL